MDSALSLSDSFEFRKRLKTAKDSQLKEKNIPLLETLVQKRQELAQILNFTSYSQMTLTGMMAKTIENVQHFHEDLATQIIKQAENDIKEINTKVTSKYHTVENPKMKDWDFQYYRNEYNLNKNKQDDNLLRQFFPLEHVKEQTMEIY